MLDLEQEQNVDGYIITMVKLRCSWMCVCWRCLQAICLPVNRTWFLAWTITVHKTKSKYYKITTNLHDLFPPRRKCDHWRWEQHVVPQRRYETNILRCVKPQKSADLTINLISSILQSPLPHHPAWRLCPLCGLQITFPSFNAKLWTRGLQGDFITK
jgi:hypothetical protein